MSDLEMAPTASKIARPASIAFTGGNGWKYSQSLCTRYQRLLSYQADVVAEDGSGRKGG
jgi:hypothetical protein